MYRWVEKMFLFSIRQGLVFIFGIGFAISFASCSNPAEQNILMHKQILNLLNGRVVASTGTTGSSSSGGASNTQTSNFTASVVYGQSNFTSGTANSGGISATSLNTPSAIAIDSSSQVYISDTGNNRVLLYVSGSTSATTIYGQASATTNTANSYGSGYAQNLNGPTGIAVDSSGSLYISDTQNDRTLIFPAGSTTANFVYGQPSPCNSISTPATAQSPSSLSLDGPSGITFDSSGKIYIADKLFNRVVGFSSGSCAATLLYGQSSYTGSAFATSQSGLYYPYDVAFDSAGNVYVSDNFNSRVLKFPSGINTASAVYGQTNYTSSIVNSGGISATSLNYPLGIFIDNSDNLYVADQKNNRVLFYPSGSTTATKVYGQTDFTSNTSGTSATTLSSPVNVAVNPSSGSVCVADGFNNRVLCY